MGYGSFQRTQLIIMWKEFSDEQLKTLRAIFRRSRALPSGALASSERIWDWAEDSPASKAASEAVAGSLEAPAPNPAPLRPTNLFDLRQTVMRNTNPLRAKILLFSLLHHRYRSDRVEQAFLLKGYELDKLLARMLQTYDQLAVLTVQLKKTARRLDNPVEYSQTAAAILRAVKPLYQESPAPLVQQSPQTKLKS